MLLAGNVKNAKLSKERSAFRGLAMSGMCTWLRLTRTMTHKIRTLNLFASALDVTGDITAIMVIKQFG